MKLLQLKKVKDGKYLKNYELTYLNKKGNEKIYEIVSRHEIPDKDALGNTVSGVSIVAYYEDKMLLLREFRMGVNHYVYNLCAGMIEDGESVEECIQRELYEETGLQVKKILQILNNLGILIPHCAAYSNILYFLSLFVNIKAEIFGKNMRLSVHVN